MSFLFPLYLLGAAAVTVPIVLHLTRRRVRRRVAFSSLMFLDPTPLTVKRRNRPEHLLLLLLRCALLVLLALMFARPFFPRPLSAAPAEPSVRTVLLIDTSASMRRTGLWDEAVNEARAVIRASDGEADRLAVLGFDRSVKRVVSFEDWATLGPGRRQSAAESRLDELSPGWGGTNLGGALIAAAEALLEAETGDERVAAERRIVLVSDVQRGAELAALRGYEWPSGVHLTVRDAAAESGSNAGLQQMLAGGRFVGDAEPTLRVRITNAEDAEAQRFRLRWEDGGKNRASRASEEAEQIHVPAGGSRVVEAPPRSESDGADPHNHGVHRPGTLVLSGDAHEFDNRLHVASQPPRPVRILYLGGTDASDAEQPLYYLNRALRQTRRQAPKITARPPDAALEPETIENAELIVLGRSPPPGSLEPIRRHLEAGGTALRTMRDPEAAETIAGLTGAEGVTAEEAEVEDYALLERIDFDHPLFAPFDEPRFSDFTKIHFWAYRRLDLGGLAEKARVLARFDRGGPAWVEIPVGSGSLLVMTSSWAPADGQLALSSKFVPLMYAVLERAAGSADRRGRFHVGDPIPLASFGSEAGRIAGIHRPDGERVIIEPDQASFEQTDTPGLYALEPEDGDPRRVAVNLDPAESRTAPMPLDRLEQFGVELGPPEVTEAGAAKAEKADGLRQERDAELERRQKVWRWVLMAALVVLMAEIWLAGRLSRSEPSPDRGVRGDRGVRDE